MQLLKKLFPFSTYLFWFWLLFILILMVIPANGISLYDFPGRDKLVHFLLFAFLGFFFVFNKKASGGLFSLKPKNWSTYLLILFSFSLELFHTQLSYRSFELLDSMANATGLILGVIFGQVIYRFLARFFI